MTNPYTRLRDPGESMKAFFIRMNREYLDIRQKLFSGAVDQLLNPGHTTPEISQEHYRILGWSEEVCRWRLGDEIIKLGDEVGANRSYRLSAGWLSKSERWSLELRRVSSTFPDHLRYYGVSWSLYRVCASSPDPTRTLADCLQRGISAAAASKRIHAWRHDPNRAETP